MTAQSIIYREQEIELALTMSQETVRVPGFVAEGTGLGYYIDKAPGASSSSLFELATGQAYMDYYVPVHLDSGRQLGWHVYGEKHVRAWIERIVPLIDWTLSMQRILALPEAQTLHSKIRAALDETTRATKGARASK